MKEDIKDFEMQAARNLLQGELPKIGIRPTIDGRLGGVRESLEAQTRHMALNVARFLSDNLRHPDGSPVECVVADRSIGGVAESIMAAENFRQKNVGVSITTTPCWCYGSETMEMDPSIPKAIWGFNGTERPGAVYLAAALAAHNQKGLPAFSIYGRHVQDAGDTEIHEDVQDKLISFAKSGLAVATLRNKSYLSMGSVSMGIAGSIVNENFFQEYLGMRNEYVDMSEFTRRIAEKIYDTQEFEFALGWVKKYCKEGPDENPPSTRKSRAEKDLEWETVVKMTMIARDLMVGNPKLTDLGYGEEGLGRNAILSGFQGQRQWTDYFPNGDFMEAILNSSFDWNGIRQPYLVATENDSLNGVSMLFGHLLTGTAQVFSDVRTYWSPEAVKRVTGKELEGKVQNGIIHLINSGSSALDGSGEQMVNGNPAIKPYWKITSEEAIRCLEATSWCPAIRDYFRGGGYSSKFVTRGGMPITMSRINLIKGVGPVMQIAEGETVELPRDMHDILDQRTNITWPTTWFVPRLTGRGAFRDVYSVMANWGANHAAYSYGHIGAQLITLASMLRIPICMHNVPTEKIYRPSVWGAFGMDSEGSDYRACANFGPLYG